MAEIYLFSPKATSGRKGLAWRFGGELLGV
jgi:hypothetical protein